MKKSTLWGAAFLGIFIFSMTMFSQAMSNTSESAMAINPIAGNSLQSVATGQSVATSNNLPTDTPERSATAMTAPKSNMLANLLRVGKRNYNVEIAPWVSRKIVNQYRVRKFGFGRLENVSIISTASGTYSSDALQSANIIYPGINVSQVRPFQPSTEIMVLVWQGQNGWKLLKSDNAPSLLTIN